MSGSSRESQSFGTVLGEGRSESVSGNYALGRTSSREESMGNTESMGRVWSLNEGLTMSETVSEGSSEAIRNTWVNSEAISTSKGFSGFIPRGRFGIFYRQTTRWVRRAEVRSYDLCGVATHMGDLQFNEWDWAPGLAIGPDCDTLPPPPNLPRAQCFVDPCGE